MDRIFVFAYFLTALLPCATLAQEQTPHPVTLHNHEEYLHINGPNSKYYQQEGSYTKWIGVNTELLTDLVVTKTVDGSLTTQTTSGPAAVVTATQAENGIEVGDISVALTPKVANVLDSLAAEAIQACGLSRKRACDARQVYAQSVQREMAAGGRLEFDFDFLPTITAPDVAAVLQAVTGVRGRALGFFVLLFILAEESPSKKIPGAVVIPHEVARPATPTSNTSTTTSGCPTNAPTGKDAPPCPDEDCQGQNDAPRDVKPTCTTGQWKHCECNRVGKSFVHPANNKLYNGKTWFEIQQDFLQQLMGFVPDQEKEIECIPGSNPNDEDLVPTAYCQCGENYESMFSVAPSTTTAYDPCPYTKAPGPEITFHPRPTPQQCYTGNAFSPETNDFTTNKAVEAVVDGFCKEHAFKELKVGGIISNVFDDPGQSSEKTEQPRFELTAMKDTDDCGPQILLSEGDCRDAFEALWKKCPKIDKDDETVGGKIVVNCQSYSLFPIHPIPKGGPPRR